VKAAAIITAAGQGQRMNIPIKKQYLVLEGVPVLARTVNAFLPLEAFIGIIVVVPPGEVEFAQKILKPFCPLDRLTLVEGGLRRQDSVFNGLQAVPAEAELICIHDGARPLVSRELILAALEEGGKWGAVVPVIPVTDTLKEVDLDGIILATLPRSRMRLAQTPQVFQQALIRDAYRQANLLGIEASDDAYLLEILGTRVHTLAGDPRNIKITGPHDLQAAAAFLKGEKE